MLDVRQENEICHRLGYLSLASKRHIWWLLSPQLLLPLSRFFLFRIRAIFKSLSGQLRWNFEANWVGRSRKFSDFVRLSPCVGQKYPTLTRGFVHSLGILVVIRKGNLPEPGGLTTLIFN